MTLPKIAVPGALATGRSWRRGCAPDLLVVHDRDDREVPYVDGAQAATLWPGARLVTTSRLGHRRILSARVVVETAAAFASGTRAPRLLLDEWSRIELDLADREGWRSRAFP